MSLLFNEQLYERVPREAHDCPVDIIVTPTKRIDCVTQRGANKMDKMLDIYELLKHMVLIFTHEIPLVI